MRLVYTPQALSELDEVLTYIAERSPRGARRVKARIQSTIDLLSEHPDIGRPTRNPRLRRIVASPYPYVIFFERREHEVVIIGVRHGARHPGSMPGA